jgi:glutamyl-tRNA synthetase
LFNWLYARHTGGTLILRIEDTDTARSTRGALDVILSGLRWLGLEWDEGPTTSDPDGASKGEYGPYLQSQRGHVYARRVEELLSKGAAYKHEGAVKFRMQREAIVIPDVIVGDVRRELTDRETEDPDFVIVRSDGNPVFHFTNVVDDLEMQVTHVIRGEDHLTNTAKHIALFRAFGAEPPKYGHIPLILNTDGSKMSKREKGASLQMYVDDGYLPQAVFNYLCLLGWSPKGNREKMTSEEVVQAFDLPQILRHNARFDLQKLLWLNGEYIRELSVEQFCQFGIEFLGRAGVPIQEYPPHYVNAAVATCHGKVKTFAELAGYADFYFKELDSYDPQAAKDQFVPDNKPRLIKLRDAFAQLPAFGASDLETALKKVATELGIKAGVLVHPVRLAVTGKTAGPSLYHLLEIVGREKVLARIDRAITQIA